MNGKTHIYYDTEKLGTDIEQAGNELGYIISTESKGYIIKLGFDVNNPTIQLPLTIERGLGSSETYITDWWHQYYELNSSAGYVVGGSSGNGGNDASKELRNGLWSYWYAATKNTLIGTRLILNK